MTKNILVVDDNPLILKLMTNLLEKKKQHNVLTATNGLDALKVLADFTPDIIFADLLIPQITGDKLCKIIRGMPKLQDTYLVVLTAMAAEMEFDVSTIGANACIAKGLFSNTEKHILTALKRADEAGASKDLPKEVMGVDEITSRRMTKELIQAKNHNDIMLGNISDGVMEIAQNSQIVYVTPIASSFLQKEEEKILGAFLPSLFSKKDSQRIKKAIKQINNKPRTVGKRKPIYLNKKYFSLTFLPLNDNNQKSFVVVLQDITERIKNERKHTKLINELQAALTEIKTLRGLIPICMHCKRIRDDDRGFWENLESYLADHSEGQFTHGVCPECRGKYYPDIETPNCWEFKLCGQENIKKCPAAKHKKGRECWLTAGTMCQGSVQGSFAQKLDSCLECDYYKYVNFTINEPHEKTETTTKKCL